jgi:hypothetical protein
MPARARTLLKFDPNWTDAVLEELSLDPSSEAERSLGGKFDPNWTDKHRFARGPNALSQGGNGIADTCSMRHHPHRGRLLQQS